MGESPQVDEVNAKRELVCAVREVTSRRKLRVCRKAEGRSGVEQAAETAVSRSPPCNLGRTCPRSDPVERCSSLADNPAAVIQVLEIEGRVLDGEIPASIARDANAVDHAGAEQIGVTEGEILDAVRGAIDRRR